MIELFAKGDTSATFKAHTERVINLINNFSDEKILGVDIDEWVIYYFDEYKIQPIVLLMDNVSQVLSETKIERYNQWHRSNPYEQQTFHIDGYRILLLYLLTVMIVCCIYAHQDTI